MVMAVASTMRSVESLAHAISALGSGKFVPG